MNLKNSRLGLGVFVVFCILSLSWCIYRDLQIRKQYPGDLRNRVVGSRLQMDGKSPYFFHWQNTDGIRYYDWNNGNTNLKISNITATPFFHQIISPVANYSQYTITQIWLAANYLAFLIMCFLAFRLCTNMNQRIAVVVTAVVFLHTHAWMNYISNGQMYLFIAMFSFAFYYILTRRGDVVNAIAAGVIAMALILIRPTTLLYLVPFLLLAPSFTKRFKLLVVGSALTVLVIAMSGSNSRKYWRDYQSAVKDHVKMHQRLNPDTQKNVYIPTIKSWEGWHIDTVREAGKFAYYKYNDANSNVFVIVNKALGVRIRMWMITALFVAALIVVTTLFFRKHRNINKMTLFMTALLGFLLYMLSDLFSPIHRFHYYASQWLFPLLLTASAWGPGINKLLVASVATGLLLHSLSFRLFPMQQVVGEYLICLSLLAILITYKSDPV